MGAKWGESGTHVLYRYANDDAKPAMPTHPCQ